MSSIEEVPVKRLLQEALVVSDPPPQERHWIVTAYIARKLEQGAIEWKRN